MILGFNKVSEGLSFSTSNKSVKQKRVRICVRKGQPQDHYGRDDLRSGNLVPCSTSLNETKEEKEQNK